MSPTPSVTRPPRQAAIQSAGAAVLCVIGLTLTAIIGGGLIVRARALERGMVAGLPGPIAHAGVALGLNVDLAGMPPAELEQALDQAQMVGATWLRQTFPWAEIEPRPGEYHWERWDPLVEAIARRRETGNQPLHLLAVLDTSPDWAQAPDQPHDRTAPPAVPASFAAFARAFATHYGSRVDAYQIWDEPNLASHWGGRPANPAEYAALLRAAADVLHAAQPGAVVVAAALAPTAETGPENLSDVLYLRALYEVGAGPAFDAAAGKPYGYDTGPDDRRADLDRLNFSHFILLREEMERHGDGDKALWAGQWGWNAPPPGWNGPPSIWGQVSEAQQAEYTVQALERVRLEWPWAGPLFLERLRGPAAADNPRWGFALVGPDGRPRPVYEALQTQAAVRDAPPLAYPGWHPAADPAARYSGGWRFSELGADISQSGDQVTFTFRGTELGLTVRRADYRAYLYVTIDGQPANALPSDERGAYLVLTAPDPAQPGVATLPVAHGLPDGVHTAEIIAERGWGQWALVGFSVGRSTASTAPPQILIGLLAVVGVGFAVGVVRFGMRVLTMRKALAQEDFRALSRPAWLWSWLAALAFYLTTWLTWGQEAASFYRRLGEAFQIGLTAAAAALFYYSPWVILNILSGLALALLILLRPDLGLMLVAFFAPFYLQPKPLWQWSFSMVEITLLMSFAAWIIRSVSSRPWVVGRFRPDHWLLTTDHWLDWGVLALVVVGAAAAVSAEFQGVAWREWRVVFLEPALFYLMLRTTPLDRRAWWRIMDAFVLGAVVVAVVGLVQYATGNNIITAEEGLVRLRSVYGSPNNVGLYLERALPLLVAVELMGRERRRRAYLGALLIIAPALVLSFSKGALFFGVPAALATVLLLWGGRRALVFLGAVAGVALAGLALLLRLPGLSERLNLASATTVFRLNLWRSTIAMIRDHPWLGVGPDNFLYQYRGHYILPAAWQEPSLSHPHNIVLDFWSRLGLPGLAVGVWLQVEFWRTGWQVWRGLRDPDGRALAAGWMGAMAATLAHGLVDNSIFLVDLAFVFILSLAAMAWLAKSSYGDSKGPNSTASPAGLPATSRTG